MSRRAFRSIAAVAALLAAAQLASAYPGDVFQSAAPISAPDRPTGAPASDGGSVSETGAALYRLPIAVPPGRGGATPDLALIYSSSNPSRGGLAAGWELPIPTIELDTSRGRLGPRVYRSSQAGRLVVVPAPGGSTTGIQHFRGEEDASYTRFEKLLTSAWRARTTDGTVLTFGDAAEARDAARWFLTRAVDRFGNEIRYTYEKVSGKAHNNRQTLDVDVALKRIEYGANANAGLAHHVRIDFTYAAAFDLCPGSDVPIGAQFSYRSGSTSYRGARRLDAVSVKVKGKLDAWTERRRVALAYDQTELTCPTGMLHAPLRMLTAVTETGYSPTGVATTSPPTSFSYGRRERLLTTPLTNVPIVENSVGFGKQQLDPTKAGGWPTVETMLLDLDGDGFVDIVSSEPSGASCGFSWRRNVGNGSFDPPIHGALPTIPWKGAVPEGYEGAYMQEGCSLAAQFTQRSNHGECSRPGAYLGYRFMDVTGDGRPDLVAAIDAKPGSYDPDADAALWPDPLTCTDELGACVIPGTTTPVPCWVNQPFPALVSTSEPSNPSDPDPWPACHIGGGCPNPACDPESTLPCDCRPDYCNAGDDEAWPIGSPQSPPEMGFWDGVDWSQGVLGDEVDNPGRHGLHYSDECELWPEMACGRYVLRVYVNEGNGQLAVEPRIILSPIPLESDRPTSDLGAGHLAASSSWHGFVDMDGDAILDAVYQTPGFYLDDPESHAFQVFRGDGRGGFLGRPDGTPYLWSTPTMTYGGRARVHLRSSLQISNGGNNEEEFDVRSTETVTTLMDINGDGLPDYVDRRDEGVQVFYNTGTGFDTAGTWLGFSAGSQKFQTLDAVDQVVLRKESNGQLEAGWSRSVLRQVDLDHDGLLDLVALPAPHEPETNPFVETAPSVHFYANVGDHLIDMGAPARASAWWQGLARVQATDDGGSWRLKSDFLDLDSDGLEDLYTSSVDGAGCDPGTYTRSIDNNVCGATPTVLTDPKDGQGMRLLRVVTTSLGGAVRFDYAPVEFDRESNVPHPIWAVTRMTTDPGHDPLDPIRTDLTFTGYRYSGPVYGQDPHGAWGFRGFRQVEITTPAGARTVTDHAFDQHYDGLAVATATYREDGDLHHRTTTTWRELALFDGAVWTWAPEDVEEHLANGAPRRVTHFYEALAPAGSTTPLVWVESGSHVRGESYPDEDLGEQTTYALRSDATSYRLVTTSQTAFAFQPSLETLSVVQHVWDAQLQLESITNTFAETGTPIVHQRQFDAATGNLLAERRPSNASTGPWTTYTYDSRKLFVENATNELGLVVKSITDPATGVVTSTRGPNRKSCGTGCEVWEGSTSTIDGFGRPIDRSVYVDDATAGYRLELAQRWTYAPASTLPWRRMKVISESRIETGGDRWVRDEVEVDGLGRVTQAIAVNPGQPSAVTSYEYDDAGVLAAVTVPRPGAHDSSTVRYTIAHDSLGRITGTTAPDGTGVRTDHDGLTTTITEVVPDGTPASTKVLTDDVEGRLRQVKERLDDGSWASTRYEYDGSGNVRRIVDPAGSTTEMDHDMLGRRVAVHRAGQTWRYGYDGDGNVTTIIAPVPTGGDPASYTTSIVYDDLGRPLSRVAGRRDLDDAELARFGASSITWQYDVGTNGLGRLTLAGTPGVSRTFAYDALGRSTSMTESFTGLPGVAFAGSRTTRHSYDLLGNPTEMRYGDAGLFGAVARPETVATFGSDARGRLDVARWVSTTTRELARLGRTTGGAVDERWDGLSSTPVAKLHRTYDDVGRPTRFRVESRLPLDTTYTTRADQQYEWFDSGDLGGMTTALASGTSAINHGWSFDYDTRHQLIGADGPNDYVAALSYDVAGRLATASIDASAAGVLDRDVIYRYDAADPHAVSSLIDAPSTTTWASYQYDVSGNMTSRARDTTVHTHAYDGADLQREVTLQDGSREVYFYDEGRQRRFTLTYNGTTLARLRWTFGGAEIEYSGTGAVTRTDAYVSLGGPVARIHKDLAASAPTAELLFHDPLDHLIAAVDAQGRLRAGYSYTPFGEVLEQIGTAPTAYDRTFNGKQQDAISDLGYYGHRYYDPISMTWTQADPLYRFVPDSIATSPRRANLYTFSLNNPLRYVDPDGLEPIVDESGAVEENDAGKLLYFVIYIDVETGLIAKVGVLEIPPENASAGPFSAGADIASASAELSTDGVGVRLVAFEATVGVDVGNGRAAVGFGLAWDVGLRDGKFKFEAVVGVGPDIEIPTEVSPWQDTPSAAEISASLDANEPSETSQASGESSGSEASPPPPPPRGGDLPDLGEMPWDF